MFGIEILDVVIGLMLVYLLLSLLATALNEYVAAVLNLRGRELARGLGRLLDDLDEKDAIDQAVNGLSSRAVAAGTRLTEQFYSHPLIRPLATREGVLMRLWPIRKLRGDRPRLPSYIPARTFSMALLDLLNVRDPQAGGVDDQVGFEAELSGGGAHSPPRDERMMAVLGILKRDSPLDVTELKGLFTAANLPEPMQVRLLQAFTSSQNRLQNLQDGVEVWFNNAMDRVSGAYKRTVQGWLFVLGVVIATCMNADTIDMWRRLDGNDALRAAMVQRAQATVAALDTAMADSAAAAAASPVATPSPRDTPQVPAPAAAPADTANPANAISDSTTSKSKAVADARRNYEQALARVDSMELQLGWTTQAAVEARLVREDSAGVYPGKDENLPRRMLTAVEKRLAPADHHADLFPFDTAPSWLKLLGLLLTAIAISLGAPFWFDLLNKVISIRSAGRSPAEKPKSPEGGPKRAAEQTPK